MLTPAESFDHSQEGSIRIRYRHFEGAKQLRNLDAAPKISRRLRRLEMTAIAMPGGGSYVAQIFGLRHKSDLRHGDFQVSS